MRLSNAIFVHSYLASLFYSIVHLGGHVQTGGFGIPIRAFGLLLDHVIAFDIITATGESLHVERNSTDKMHRDLYYAVLGGSPWNFGVLTHITLQAHRDEDHPYSLGYRASFIVFTAFTALSLR